MKVEIHKNSLRQLDETVMQRQIEKIVSRMSASGRDRNWKIRAKQTEATAVGNEYRYGYTVSFQRIGRDAPEETKQKQINRMLEIGQAAGNSSGWAFPNVSPGEPESNGKPVPVSEQTERTYANVVPKTDKGEFFSHIYEREPQIEVVHSAVTAFVDSDYNNRFHAVLYGEPACGKTEILRSFSKMLGTDAVLELDATSTTKAGAERILLETKELPPILICEEIEKTDEQSLRWLLGVLDHRGEIRKVTHRTGLKQRNVKMLCLATVNDLPLFKRVMDGALASRFSHKVYCPRPSKDVLSKILAREVMKVGGNPAWISPAVDYCVDVEKTNDPRRVTTVCLSGKDRLLTGEYQKLLKAVTRPD